MSENENDILISGYCTVRNAVEMDYPFEQSILSMLEFCNEVVVLDSSDQNDGTLEKLTQLAEKDGRIIVLHADVDWKAPNHGICDGQTKALARSYCNGDFLWQFDVDEIMHEDDVHKVRPLIQKLNYLQECPLVALPVIEYWGSEGKVRMDINPWKWRLSRNIPDITHGIPIGLRKIENGLLYANHGTDSCDYISNTTGQPIPCLHFMQPEVNNVRIAGMTDIKFRDQYEQWFNYVAKEFPSVYHYSWFSIARKIKQYKLFWTTFWKALYNEDRDPSWNPFFDVSWDQVTDDMINQKAKELQEKTGGWIFHNKWNGTKTNHVTIHKNPPKIMKEWIESHK